MFGTAIHRLKQAGVICFLLALAIGGVATHKVITRVGGDIIGAVTGHSKVHAPSLPSIHLSHKHHHH